MLRCHLWEFNDLAWFPQTFRDALTAYLGTLERWSKPYHVIHQLILDAIRDGGQQTVVDLCTGDGVSALALRESASADGMKIKWLLADLFPSERAVTFAGQEFGSEVVHLSQPINACELMLDGYENAFRTLFTAFHHFRPEDAGRILQNAVDAGAGIAIAEFTDRSFVNCLKYLAAPILVCCVMLGIRPIRWDWLLFTFVISVLPFTIAWDGLVSNLRTYSPDELRDLVQSVSGHEQFRWDIGIAHGSRMFPTITYLIGTPVAA